MAKLKVSNHFVLMIAGLFIAAAARAEQVVGAAGRAKAPVAFAQPSWLPPTNAFKKVRAFRDLPPEVRQQWDKILATLWTTPLGELYTEFLTSSVGHRADLSSWAEHLCDRVFRERVHASLRVKVLELLDEDLYDRPDVTEDMKHRSVLFREHLEQYRADLNQQAITGFINKTAFIVALSFPFGFKKVRVVSNRLFKNWLAEVNGRSDLVSRVHLGDVLERSTLHEFNVLEFMSVFGAIVGTDQGAEFLYAWYQSSRFGPKDETLLLGLDELLNSTNLRGN